MTEKSQTMKLSGKANLGLGATANISVTMRNYFSTHFLLSAKHFISLVANIENRHKGNPIFSIEHRGYVLSSILSSVAFLEAAINELYQDAYDKNMTYIKNLDSNTISILSDYWDMTEQDNKSLSILDKYQLALRFANKEPFLKGENPYQDTSLVIRLRNDLIHYKPLDLDEKKTHKLDIDLKNKSFLSNKLMKGSDQNFYPDHALGNGCIEWCLSSVKNFADEFFKRIRIEPNYQVVDIEKLAGNK